MKKAYYINNVLVYQMADLAATVISYSNYYCMYVCDIIADKMAALQEYIMLREKLFMCDSFYKNSSNKV